VNAWLKLGTHKGPIKAHLCTILSLALALFLFGSLFPFSFQNILVQCYNHHIRTGGVKALAQLIAQGVVHEQQSRTPQTIIGYISFMETMNGVRCAKAGQ